MLGICPHCGGIGVYEINDQYEHYESCLYCGYRKDIRVFLAASGTPAPLQARVLIGRHLFQHEISRGVFTEKYLATKI